MTLHVISDSEVSGFKICSVCYHSYSNLFVYCNIHFCSSKFIYFSIFDINLRVLVVNHKDIRLLNNE